MIHVQLNINWINSCTISRFINHTFWYTLYVTSPSKSVHLGVLELVWKCAICTINVHFHTKLTAPKLTLVLGGTTYDIWSYYMWGKYLGLCCPRGRADFLVVVVDVGAIFFYLQKMMQKSFFQKTNYQATRVLWYRCLIWILLLLLFQTTEKISFCLKWKKGA